MSEPIPKAPLSEVADITMGQSPDSAYVNEEEHGWPFLQGCAEFGARHPMAKVHCMPPLRTARAGSTLISVRAPVGAMNRADQDYCIGRGLAAVFAKPGYTDNIFLLHAIEENLSFLHRRSQGSTFLAIGTADLSMMPVAAPPLAQQQRIAEILATVDEAIEQTEALIAKTQQIKAGLMHDLFTRGVTKDGQLRPPREEAPYLYKESPLGWIPKEWEFDSIGSQFSIQLGKMLNKLAKTGRFSAPYVGNRAIQWDKVDLAGLEEMDFTPSEREKFRLQPGDLLVCEGGEVGRTAMWRGEIDECYYQKALHRLRPLTSRILNEYMLRFMRFACDSGMFRVFTSQSSIAHLTQEKLSTIRVLLPRIQEQEQIANLIETVDGDIETEQTSLSKQLKIKQGLMHDLLTGRVRVKTESLPPTESTHV